MNPSPATPQSARAALEERRFTSDPIAEPASLVVLSLNVGAGQRGRYAEACPGGESQRAAERALADAGRVLADVTRKARHGGASVAIALQEVDVRTARVAADTPARVVAALPNPESWHHRFLAAMPHCPSSAAPVCTSPGHVAREDSRCAACRGEYGLATFASTSIVEALEHRYQWYSADTFGTTGGRASDAPWHLGMEPRVALATRVETPASDLWVVNTHLGGYVAPGQPDESVAVRQIEELAARAASMFGETPTLLVGDFNIVRLGRHRTGDPRFASNGEAYRRMVAALTGAGFVELGDRGATPCWETNTCTTTPWGNYSVIDYAWLRDPRGLVAASSLRVIPPTVADSCYVTDHSMLSIALSLSSPESAR